MRWVQAASTSSTLTDALVEVIVGVQQALEGSNPDLVLVFSSMHHGLHWDGLVAALTQAFDGAVVVGCSGGAVIGGGHEHEGGAGLVLLAGVLPHTELHPFHLPSSLVALDAPPSAASLRAVVGVDPDLDPAILLFVDPFSSRAEPLMAALDAAYPRGTVVGGLASGAREPGRHALFGAGGVVPHGAVGVAMVGDVALEAVVAQGCRAVGGEHRVTEAEGHLVKALDDAPALPFLEATFKDLPAEDRRLFQRSPMVGLATRPGDGHDYLVRHVVGIDPPRSAFAVGHQVAPGDVLRFHVRDAASSVQDLHDVLGRFVHARPAPEAVLMVSCLGRGAGFYGADDVDLRTVQAHVGDAPVAGFFGNGELGPVHGRTFVHGYTCVLGMIRSKDWN